MNFWQYLIEKRKIAELTSATIRQLAPEMSEIENRHFSGLYANDEDDLIDNSEYAGFLGFGVFDDFNNIKGYITGYKMEDDELDPELFAAFNQVKFYDKKFEKQLHDNLITGITPEQISKAIVDQTFHVINFVIDKEDRIEAYKLLKTFLDAVRAKGYKYLSFDALEDTQHLFMRDQMVKTSRLNKNNLRLILTYDDGESVITLMGL
jgi:hypothetical protein